MDNPYGSDSIVSLSANIVIICQQGNFFHQLFCKFHIFGRFTIKHMAMALANKNVLFIDYIY